MSKIRSILRAVSEVVAEPAATVFLLFGSGLLLFRFALVLKGSQADESLLAISLALLSVGLGCSAISMSLKADKRHTSLLEKLDTKVSALPQMFKDDFLTPFGQEAQSKQLAQKRVAEDAAKVGYVRGEPYRTEDGHWAVHWGGKYPL